MLIIMVHDILNSTISPFTGLVICMSGISFQLAFLIKMLTLQAYFVVKITRSNQLCVQNGFSRLAIGNLPKDAIPEDSTGRCELAFS